ncbi:MULTISPECIES: hypothetical protein [Paenibacillus]|uniref:hypothetical protein n=1 Tax=Paenibacillus TaxID=44249 RepID=UPI0022B91913|nr:hypothetical protein [Paenibacillus caseinilyticus]MCZ8520377.1 hypothetical protein [Paenibacillus caseinilyticus]
MSIQVLSELHGEVRRLFIAGSGLARGDLRLRAMQAQLEKLGGSAPIFAKLSEGVQALLDADAEEAAGRLLELGTLLHAVLYTQGRTEAAGELIETPAEHPTGETPVPYRKLKPLIDALTERGPGRLEVVQSAYQEGMFGDIRTHLPAVDALGDTYTEIADFIQTKVIPSIGERAEPLLLQRLDLEGGRAEARKLHCIHGIRGAADPSLYLRALAEGAPELRIAAVTILGGYPEQEDVVLEASQSRRKDLREAALLALSRLATVQAADRLLEELTSAKDPELAVEPIRKCAEPGLTARVISYAEELLGQFREESKPEETLVERMAAAISCLSVKQGEEVRQFLQKLLDTPGFMVKETEESQEEAALALLEQGGPATLGFVEGLHRKWSGLHLSYSVLAALRTLSPGELYDRFSPYLQYGSSPKRMQLLHTIRQHSAHLDDPAIRTGEAAGTYTWDPRWLPLFIANDDEELVCRFAPDAPDPEVTSYILAKLQADQGKRVNYPALLLSTLKRMRHEEAPEALIRVLEQRLEQRAGSSAWWYIEHDLLRLVQELPASYAGRIEGLAGLATNEGVRRSLVEAAQALQNKGQDLQADDHKGAEINL